MDCSDIKNIKKELKNFHSMVNHDMRMPLLAILGYTDMFMKLKNNKLDDEKISAMVSGINRAGKKLLRVVENIITASGLESGKLKPSRKHVDIRLLLKEVGDELPSVSREKGLVFSLPAEDGPVVAFVDKEMIKRAVLSLFYFAVGRSERGTVIDVTANGSPDGKFTEITIASFPALLRREDIDGSNDNGIVEIFTARTIAEAHGGCLDIGLTEDKKLILTLSLPQA